MTENTNTCEHGHLARKCEVCELKSDVARLRSVCREAATTVRRVGYMTTEVYSSMLVRAAKTLAEAGKEATDGNV